MGNQQAQADTKAALCQDMAALCKNNPYLPDREGYKRIALSDREWINPMLLAEEGFATDSCFGTYYLWGDAFGLRVSAVGERLLASLGSGEATTTSKSNQFSLVIFSTRSIPPT